MGPKEDKENFSICKIPRYKEEMSEKMGIFHNFSIILGGNSQAKDGKNFGNPKSLGGQGMPLIYEITHYVC